MRGFRFRGRFGPQSSPWWRTRPHTATEGAVPVSARSTTAQGTQRQLPSAMLLPAGACPMSTLLERAASHLQRPVGSPHRLLVCHAQPPPGPRHCQTNGCELGTRPKYQHSAQSHRLCNETVTMDDRPTQTLVLGSHLFAMCSASEAIARPRGGPGNDRKSYSLPPADLVCAGLLLTSLPCHQHMQTQPNVTAQCNSQSATGPGICGSWICRLRFSWDFQFRHGNVSTQPQD